MRLDDGQAAIDAEATTMDFSSELADDLDDCAQRADEAMRKGAAAFKRLLQLAETRDSGQIARIARLLAAAYNGQAFPFDPYDMRAVDVAIADDMLQCLDALRWRRADLHTLVPDGDRRMRAVIDRWGLRWPAED